MDVRLAGAVSQRESKDGVYQESYHAGYRDNLAMLTTYSVRRTDLDFHAQYESIPGGPDRLRARRAGFGWYDGVEKGYDATKTMVQYLATPPVALHVLFVSCP